MSFGNTERWVAFEAETFAANLAAWNAELGTMAWDGNEHFKTIFGCWDDTAHTRKRGSWYEPQGTENTIAPIALTDGRIAIFALWNAGFLTALEEGAVTGEELTAEQVEELREENE